VTDAPGSAPWLPLLADGPAAVKRWLVDNEPGQQSPSRTVDWLGLAETTATLARTELNPEWAEVAVSIYGQLAAKVESPSRRESLMYSQMNLRAFMITRLGATAGHAVLDPRPVVDWFLETLRLSIAEATEASSHWQDLGVAQIRELRRIKNRLAPVKLLDDAGLVPSEFHATLSPWLAVRDQLP
jgi:hypothetical protein